LTTRNKIFFLHVFCFEKSNFFWHDAQYECQENIYNCGNRDQSNIPFESFPFNKPRKRKEKRGILKEKVIFRKTGGTLHLEYTRKRLSFFIYSGLFLSPKRKEREKKNFVMREAYNEFSGIPYGYWRGR